MLFELRQYTVNAGHQADWVRLMEDEIIPFQTQQGMVIVGSFVGEGDETMYVWIRRFKDEAERERQYKAVYESDHWKQVIAPKVGPMLNREQIKVTRLTATPKSVIQ